MTDSNGSSKERTRKGGIFRAYGFSALLVVGSSITGQAQTDSWVSTAPGDWEDASNWSAGTVPSSAYSDIVISNEASKTVVISPDTAYSSPGTMTISNLTLSATRGMRNELLLLTGDKATPLEVLNGLQIQPGGWLEVDNSFLLIDSIEDGNFLIGGTALVRNGGQITAACQQMTVSNGTLLANELDVSLDPGSQGTLTIANGTVSLSSVLDIGVSATAEGTVWLTDGQLWVPNGSAYIGDSGVGEMTISNGTFLANAVGVGVRSGSQGTLTIAGGSLNVLNNMVAGNFSCDSLGAITMSGGTLYVTNATKTAVLEIRSGTLELKGGQLVADQLVITNSCGHFLHTGGTFKVGSVVLDPNVSAVGDGIPKRWKLQYGLDPLDPAVANADSDGDGLTNLQEYLAGTDPTNSASALRIIGVTMQGSDVMITWRAGGGRTNVVQAGRSVSGVYSNISPNIAIPDVGDVVTNYLDKGAATNTTFRFYRVSVSSADTLPPLLTIASPADYSYTTNSTVDVTGTCLDDSGVSWVEVQGLAASSGDAYSNWTAVVSGLTVGTNTLVVLASDNAAPANIATNIVHVIYASGSFDGNSDGLPGAWQIKYFGSVNAPDASPTADPDGDGMTNLQEYLAGTDPTNPASALRITAIVPVGADIRVYFTSISGKYYYLERCDSLGSAWTNIVENIAGNGGIQSVNDTVNDISGAARSTAFYRVGLAQLSGPPPEDSDGDGIPDWWTQKYFGHPTRQAADNSLATDDPDGDGFTNLQEYLAGTDPTNSASAFRITSLVSRGYDVLVTWTMGSGKTNALQASAGNGGSFTNAFTDIFTVTNTVGTVTNYLDTGGATNSPSRYYRVRLVP